MAPRMIHSDAQRKRVYEWEDQWKDWSANKALSKKKIRQLIVRALRQIIGPRFRTPRIKWLSDKDGYNYYNIKNHTMGLLPVGRNFGTVLHETAHVISRYYFGTTVEDHGPEFMGIFLYLLERYGQYPRGTVTDSAAKAKLRIDYKMGPAYFRKASKRDD